MSKLGEVLPKFWTGPQDDEAGLRTAEHGKEEK